ncbi:hypothetical protein GCM10010442_20950 [Kitasatospora kifunensis]
MAPDGPDPREPAEAVLTSTARLGADRRLDIYRRGYRLRLLEAMRGLHPGLCALLGRELFEDFALEYLDARPSRSPSLHQLGRHFAGHLAKRRPDRDRPPELRERWIDLVIDLARYEQVFAEVYDGPGTEGRTDQLSGESIRLDATVQPSPCLRLLTLCGPVHGYVAAVRRGEQPAPPEPRPVRLAVSRRAYLVTTTELSPDAYDFLSALLHGATVEAAATEAELALPAAAQLLRGWAADRWLCRQPPHPA